MRRRVVIEQSDWAVLEAAARFSHCQGARFASIAKSTIACAMGSVEGSPPQTVSARRYCPRDLRRHVVGKR